MCEASLRVPPHFGLWLKVFNVKPKVVSGEHAECGGTMVRKTPNVTWPTGTFNDSVKEWQQQWFYITEPHGKEWAAAPEFRSRAPLRLTSWHEKGLSWASSDKLSELQTRVQDMEDKSVKLINVVQVMLVHRIRTCQHRACNLWEFDPDKHQTLL